MTEELLHQTNLIDFNVSISPISKGISFNSSSRTRTSRSRRGKWELSVVQNSISLHRSSCNDFRLGNCPPTVSQPRPLNDPPTSFSFSRRGKEPACHALLKINQPELENIMKQRNQTKTNLSFPTTFLPNVHSRHSKSTS